MRGFVVAALCLALLDCRPYPLAAGGTPPAVERGGSGGSWEGAAGAGGFAGSGGAAGSGGDPFLPRDMVRVPAGRFVMGSPMDEVGRDDNELAHEVTITRPFFLGIHEVTRGEWRERMGTSPRTGDCDECPVGNVTWYAALAYANARSSAEGLDPCFTIDGATASVNTADGSPLSCRGYRLPTEAEWEYAYRAGTTTAYYDGSSEEDTGTPCIGAGGLGVSDNLDHIGWYCFNSNEAKPVGLKEANAWGLKDVAGNVWEWCWDEYAPYPPQPVTDPLGMPGEANRVSRGGSYNFGAWVARAAFRGRSPGSLPLEWVGLRLARTASAP